ncbi:MAG TPA: PqqD family protein [Acidimicrobiales bacterium]|nr:PqqD family protein [Acidimicrobiales bacterium]
MSDEWPVAAQGLEVNESGEGVVIFDAATDRVHHLNNTAALVLELCDGRRGIEEIAALIGAGFGLAEPPIIESRQCLERLRAEGLVN